MTTESTSTLTAGDAVQFQIYNGLLAGGTLGTPMEFMASQDDMIQSMAELRTAATLNLASFILSIPGRFYYEIGIQSSYTTAAGFTQRGAPVRIVTGYTAKSPSTAEVQAMINAGTWVAGTKVQVPKYKTIYNKFAIMKIGIKDTNGKNIKLASVVLGPVNAVDFVPTQVDLLNLQQNINTGLFTSDTSAIKNIITAAPVATTPAATPPPATTPPQTTPISEVPKTSTVPTAAAETLQNFSVYSSRAMATYSGLSYDAAAGVIRNAGGGILAYTRDPNPQSNLGIDHYNSTQPAQLAYAKYLQLGGTAAAATSTGGTATTSVSSPAPSTTTSPAPAAPAPSSTQPQYTFTPTAYGTIEIRKGGELFTTATVATARIYGYNG
jgi:hypothetical protein